MPFDIASPEHMAAVRTALSAPRLAPFEIHAGNDRLGGLRLYEWNLRAGSACFLTLHAVEIVLRNTLFDQMTAWHTAQKLPGCWFDDPLRLLDQRCHLDIAHARRRLHLQGLPTLPERILTELSFGFWRFLLAKRYERTLWEFSLRHGFPHLPRQRRRDVAEPVERLHKLRNRVAHHEPIYKRDLVRDMSDARLVLGAISPSALAWAEENSTLPAVILQRPEQLTIPLPRCP